MADSPWRYEEEAWARGARVVAGVDEVGRGPLAGPVVAACVVLPKDFDATGIGDSKKLTAKQRERAYERILVSSAICGIGYIDSTGVDSLNILRATHAAMAVAVQDALAHCSIDMLLVDGLPVPSLPVHAQKAIVGGDGKSASIGAASIIAKVFRDRMMLDYDTIYPGYGFAGHKGYGSAGHLASITALGPCPIHRRSFAPFKTTSLDTANLKQNALGKQGELAAVDLLQSEGYILIDTNVRPIRGSGRGELDIVGWDGPCLVFVEVKTRTSSRNQNGGPLEAVTSGKRSQIIGLAQAYIGKHNLNDVPCRFDVVEVYAEHGKLSDIRLIRNAFDAHGT